jgi:putative tryptophan/tyrosine transport system substrate-binding protein
MRRRTVLKVLGTVALSPPLMAQTPKKVWHIGAFHVGLDHIPPSLPVLRTKLRELGYVEGANLNFDWRNQADEDQARATAREFVAERVDLIVAFEDQTVRAAKASTASIPIVFVHVYDPVAAGYVQTLAHPGGNLTGIVSFLEVVGKRLELFKQIVPAIEHVLVLVDPEDPSTPRELGLAREAAMKLRIGLLEQQVSSPEQAERVFATLHPGDADAVLTVSPSLQTKFMATLIRLAWAAHVPIAAHRREWVQQEKGALFSYAPNFAPAGNVAAQYVDEILRGASPRDLPVQRLDDIQFVINLKAASALGLAIPEVMVARANEVIE